MLGGLALLILVAGAANVASVLVARAAASARQTAIHLSLGAGRLALVRRLLVEGLGLGLIGGAMALLWYAWARQQLAEVALLPTFSLRLDLPLDGQVVGDRGLDFGSLRARVGRWSRGLDGACQRS